VSEEITPCPCARGRSTSGALCFAQQSVIRAPGEVLARKRAARNPVRGALIVQAGKVDPVLKTAPPDCAQRLLEHAQLRGGSETDSSATTIFAGRVASSMDSEERAGAALSLRSRHRRRDGDRACARAADEAALLAPGRDAAGQGVSEPPETGAAGSRAEPILLSKRTGILRPRSWQSALHHGGAPLGRAGLGLRHEARQDGPRGSGHPRPKKERTLRALGGWVSAKFRARRPWRRSCGLQGPQSSPKLSGPLPLRHSSFSAQ